MLLMLWPQGLQPQTCHGRVCVGHSASWQREEGRTQTLLEPLQPMQTEMCNETMCPYWHCAVQGDVCPPWAPRLPFPPFQHTKSQSRTGWVSASQGHIQVVANRVHRGLGWGRPCQP